MNNTIKIKELLDKYFEGETSLKEEKELKEYFNGKEVATELQVYQGLFQFLKQEKNIALPEEKSAATTSLYKGTNPAKSPTNIRQMYIHVMKIAAIALVAICAYFLLPKATPPPPPQQAINWEKYEITDEEEAVEKTIAALRLVSAKLNGGAKRAAKEVHQVQAAAKVFKK